VAMVAVEFVVAVIEMNALVDFSKKKREKNLFSN
jgi:hypothetical protein